MGGQKITDKMILEKLKTTLDSIVDCQDVIESCGQDVIELLLGAVNDILHDTCRHYYQTGSLSPRAIDPPEPACHLGRNPDNCFYCDLFDNEIAEKVGGEKSVH